MKTSGHKVSDVSDKSGNSEGASAATEALNRSPAKQQAPNNPMKSSFSKMG